MRSADVRLVALLFIAGLARAQAPELTAASPGAASNGSTLARDPTRGALSGEQDTTLGALSGNGAQDTTGAPSGEHDTTSDADAPRSAQPTRSARLLGESVTVASAGLVLPVVTWVGLTAGLQSFVGFFAGVLGGSVLGLVIAPIAVAIAHRLLGGDGGAGRAVVGALVGLVVGLRIGVPLATVPSGAYLVGLALAWVMPSVGAAIALELGSPPRPQAGVVVARF